MNTLRAFALVGTVAVAALAPSLAGADAFTPPATDTQAVDLHKLAKDKKSNYEVKDSTGAKRRWGHAEIFVKAPVAKTRAAVLDYGNYSTFISKFEKSKLLKKDGLAADVFLQMPILKGSATLWALEHFNTPASDGKWEKITATMIKGNVEDMQAFWRYRAVDEKTSIVSLDLFTVPKLNVPEKLMTEQLEDACGEAVLGVRARAEGAK
jgi:ribosome-associated toxin RatA of RatAB toxin-antitoxin module